MSPGVTAVFDSVDRAERARQDLHAMGVHAVLSIDLTADGIAAEMPGQAYQNQPGQGGDGHGSASLMGLLSGRTADEQQAVARRAARIQSGGCVLSVDLDAQRRPAGTHDHAAARRVQGNGAWGNGSRRPGAPPDGAGVRAVLQAHGARHLD